MDTRYRSEHKAGKMSEAYNKRRMLFDQITMIFFIMIRNLVDKVRLNIALTYCFFSVASAMMMILLRSISLLMLGVWGAEMYAAVVIVRVM